MKFDKEACNRFFEPWKYANELGIPEVAEQEIKVIKHLGSGKKSSAKLATWNGRSIALKSWYSDNENYADSSAYSYWEILRYCNLKNVQGSLVPELFFVSRQKDTGTLVLGLELGTPVSGYESGLSEAKAKLKKDLQKEGWVQRSGSFRNDNLVWMQNEDNSKRLVAIDLESFIPYFMVKEAEGKLYASSMNTTVFGLPEISPDELYLSNCDTSWEWTTHERSCTGMWRKDKKVQVIPYYRDALEIHLERYELLKKEHGTLVPRPLFLARERNGRILLGVEHFEMRHFYECDDKVKEELQGPLAKLGWKVNSSSLIGLLGVDEAKHPIVFNLAQLEELEPVPRAVAIDESDDETSSAGSSPIRAKKQKTASLA